jgi:hypothetical protein
MIIKTARKIATLTLLAVSLSATSFAQDNTETIYFDEQSFPQLDFGAGTEAFGQKLELAFGDMSTAANAGPDPLQLLYDPPQHTHEIKHLNQPPPPPLPAFEA